MKRLSGSYGYQTLIWMVAVITAASGLAAAPALADWRYRLGDDARWSQGTIDDPGWEASEPLAFPLYSDRIVWLRTIINLSEVGPGKAVYLGVLPGSDVAYLNGVEIGATGVSIDRLSEYIGSGVQQLARAYRLPAAAQRVGDNTLTVRLQTLDDTGEVRQAAMVLTIEEALAKAARADAARIIRDSIWVALLFIGAAISLTATWRRPRDRRNLWLGAALAALGAAALPHTVLAAKLGWYGPTLAMASDFTPYIMLAVLHLASAVEARITTFQWICLAIIYTLVAASWLLALPILYYSAATTAAMSVIVILGCASILTVLRARRAGVRISPWLYAAAGLIILSAVASEIDRNQPEVAFTLLYFTLIAVVMCLLMAMFDDQQWIRRQAVTLNEQLIMSRDVERARLARALHDSVSQNITVARFRLERMEGRLSPEAGRAISPLIEDLRQIGEEVASLVEGLRPDVLPEAGLAETLTHAADRWSRLADFRVDVSASGALPPRKKAVEPLFRIAQECVLNAVRHGGANRIRITLGGGGGSGRMTVQDDGRGFNPRETEPGLGLTEMRERVRLIGGSFEIQSGPGEGVRIIIGFPIR